MNNPVAVLISDVHYNMHTLPLADAAMRHAILIANDLEIPLIVAGDLHDTKANLRGECMNAMRTTFNSLDSKLPCYILRGNHDAINEKSEEHSIGFLEVGRVYEDGCTPYEAEHEIIIKPGFYNELGCVNGKSVHVVPYQHDPEAVREYLKKVDKGSCIIMHQGLQGSNMGDYIQDKSAINHEDVADFRVISGHYHARQDIKTGRPQKGCVGLFSYIGNPYTMSYGEANDPEKGFQILMDDGSLEFVSTNLRKHVVIDTVVHDLVAIPYQHKPGDLLWFKCRGTREELRSISRELIAGNYDINEGFKLDLIPEDVTSNTPILTAKSNDELMDSLIDSLTSTSDARKVRLKELWRESSIDRT
jgi:DNA repair exonuclease SbcCD nuclease subunit